MSEHYLKNYGTADYEIDEEAKTFTVRTRRMFKALASYDSSTPTAPSDGRIYKRNFNWRNAHKGEPGNWWVYLVKDDPKDGGKSQLHHPYKLICEPDVLRDKIVNPFLEDA